MDTTENHQSIHSTASEPNVRKRGVPYFRWVIGTLLFCAAILNYTDRQALAILKPTIAADIQMTDADYARVNQLFFIAYTIANLLSGRLVDLLGPRLSMVAFVGWWSISNIATAFARTPAGLGVCRFFLGFGEAGNWPASTKVVSEWFPARERSAAVGFYTLGATLGASIAPWIVINLATNHWQTAFVVTGLMGFVWIPIWAIMYRSPKKHPLITQKDLDVLVAQEIEKPAESLEKVSEIKRWGMALSIKAVWILMIARMLTDCIWYFYQQWYASYLSTERSVSQTGLAVTGTLFFAADVGAILGGLASLLFAKRGCSAPLSRLLTMLFCALLMFLSPLVAKVETTQSSIIVACIIAFAHMAWLVNITALTVDIIPKHLLATCFGITAAGSAMGGIFMNDLVAYFAKSHQYQEWFLIMTFLHPIAWIILFIFGFHRNQAAQ